jgi:hypothetical protein
LLPSVARKWYPHWRRDKEILVHARIVRSTQNNRTYEHVQLVQSFRRPDGMPALRVVANLGSLADFGGTQAFDNLKAALRANREGKGLVVSTAQAKSHHLAPLPILANFRYLDIAVIIALWNQWGLSGVLDECFGPHLDQVSPSAVVAALATQRCLDPGSKLSATRWFPQTALPELLGLAPKAFNNTRLHRVLDDLDAATPALMARLPKLYRDQDGAFAHLFIDVTDTWFVGHGPEGLARKGKTKEGFVRRKIGIVLLCNQDGLPLRWEVVRGTVHDSGSMADMLQAVRKRDFAQQVPLVCDRAMGKTAQIEEMAQTGLHFVTALTTTEFDSYATALPHHAFADFEIKGTDVDQPLASDVARAAAVAVEQHMHKADDNLFVLDLGLVEPSVKAEQADQAGPAHSLAAIMQLARQLDELVTSGQYSSQAAAGRALGLPKKSLACKYCGLRKLDEGVQRDILAGRAEGYALADLLRIAAEPKDGHRARFEDLLRTAPSAPSTERRGVPQCPEADAAAPLRFRVVGYFNPERFVEQRLRARKVLADVQAFVARLNQSLKSPRARRTRDDVVAAVDRELRARDLLDAFQVNIQVQDQRPLSLQLTLDPQKWARRGRYDGFTVLVAHPEITLDAAGLAKLYRAKDAIEKDFQVIKSVVELRPLRHRTEQKIRAHVTLCMLSLLLERTLTRRLRGQGSSKSALEMLRSCHLNLLATAPNATAYTLTRPSPEHIAILKKLGLRQLADEAQVSESIRPR